MKSTVIDRSHWDPEPLFIPQSVYVEPLVSKGVVDHEGRFSETSFCPSPFFRSTLVSGMRNYYYLVDQGRDDVFAYTFFTILLYFGSAWGVRE